MDKNYYKKIFIRFLKENGVYEEWLDEMKNCNWKGNIHLFFKYVNPIEYINKSIVDMNFFRKEYEKLNRKLVGLDFEWKLIMATINEDNWKYVLSYINSNYFNSLNLDMDLYLRFLEYKTNKQKY